jgi:hypothetical protein
MQKPQLFGAVLLGAIVLLIAHFGLAQNSSITHLDHLTIAVKDLEQAKKDFKALGFTIKPGRVHANSIENAHIKFQDETALELITASAPLDELAKQYLTWIDDGGGPAYVCLRMDEVELTEKLIIDFDPGLSTGSYYQMLTFPDNSPLSYLFFIKYTDPPVDLREHLQHQNGVVGIKSLSLEKADFSNELSMFHAIGSDINPNHDNIVLGDHAFILGLKKKLTAAVAPVVSITLFVKDILETMEQFPKGIPFHISGKNRIIVPADYCHGIQIVFDQKP